MVGLTREAATHEPRAVDELNDGDFAPTSDATHKPKPLPKRKDDPYMEVRRTIQLAAIAGVIGSSAGGAIGSDLWLWLKMAVAWFFAHIRWVP